MNYFNKKLLFLLYSISGILLGSGFVLPATWPLVFIGVILFIFVSAKTSSLSRAVFGGFITWTIKSLFGIFLIWDTYPIEWIELSLGRTEVIVIGFYWLTVSMFLGFGGALFSFLWWFIKKHFFAVYGLVFFPLIWVIGEIFGSVIFSICTLGEGIGINAAYSFGYLGYLLGYHNKLILLASFGGVYVLSFTVVFLSYLCWLVGITFSKRESVFIVLCLVLILWGSNNIDISHSKTIEEESISVAVIDTKFGEDFFDKENREDYKYKQLIEAVDAALDLETDYILLPEDSRFANTSMSPDLAYRMFRFQSGNTKTILIDSGRVELPSGKTALRATIFDGLSKKGWITDKQYLVPQGEFMPYFYQFTLSAVGERKAVMEIKNELSNQPGPIDKQIHFPAFVPGIMFCFESADPNAVRRLLRERDVPFIVHPVSHAWFHESKILWSQLDNMLKIQAIWNNKDIISAGNMSRGALYNKKGEVHQPEIKAEGESWRVGIIKL